MFSGLWDSVWDEWSQIGQGASATKECSVSDWCLRFQTAFVMQCNVAPGKSYWWCRCCPKQPNNGEREGCAPVSSFYFGPRMWGYLKIRWDTAKSLGGALSGNMLCKPIRYQTKASVSNLYPGASVWWGCGEGHGWCCVPDTHPQKQQTFTEDLRGAGGDGGLSFF